MFVTVHYFIYFVFTALFWLSYLLSFQFCPSVFLLSSSHLSLITKVPLTLPFINPVNLLNIILYYILLKYIFVTVCLQCSGSFECLCLVRLTFCLLDFGFLPCLDMSANVELTYCIWLLAFSLDTCHLEVFHAMCGYLHLQLFVYFSYSSKYK